MSDAIERRIAAVRRFSRLYTQRIGLLHDSYLHTGMSLAQSRVLYELASRDTSTASELAGDLAIDPGYLSRILRGFEKQGFLTKSPSATDRRQMLLRLTDAGHRAFAPLDARSRKDIGAMLRPLASTEQKRLVEAMATIETLLGSQPERRAPWLLRPHRAGDWGWIVERHGALYAEEYGWDETFEGLVADIVGSVVRKFDPTRERCWIAEKDGENVGSVVLVAKSRTVAKLRLLIVDPKARGLGIGARLVAECEGFARESGYRTITLWTNSVLTSARRIYEAAGYRLVDTERHASFGHDLIGETWEKSL